MQVKGEKPECGIFPADHLASAYSFIIYDFDKMIDAQYKQAYSPQYCLGALGMMKFISG